MSNYRIARALYRATDRAVLGRLPARLEWRVRALIVRVARRFFPGRIEARSAGELAASSLNRHGAALPAWSVDELRELTALEPALEKLLDGSTPLEAYVIPWDATYVGKRYAAARRQLDTGYGAFVLHDGAVPPEAATLVSLASPLAIIDVTPDAAAGPLAARLGARHVWLPAEHLDRNDHCAVLARLVLQCSPREVVYAGGLAQACVDRHGLAMRSVSTLRCLGESLPDTPAM